MEYSQTEVAFFSKIQVFTRKMAQNNGNLTNDMYGTGIAIVDTGSLRHLRVLSSGYHRNVEQTRARAGCLLQGSPRASPLQATEGRLTAPASNRVRTLSQRFGDVVGSPLSF